MVTIVMVDLVHVFHLSLVEGVLHDQESLCSSANQAMGCHDGMITCGEFHKC